MCCIKHQCLFSSASVACQEAESKQECKVGTNKPFKKNQLAISSITHLVIQIYSGQRSRTESIHKLLPNMTTHPRMTCLSAPQLNKCDLFKITCNLFQHHSFNTIRLYLLICTKRPSTTTVTRRKCVSLAVFS